ncbi:hypothetical protein FNL37_0342 [Methylovorus glucosotrophus]|jgi:hypothetical protein|uniref:Uncharacterized protein n=1 Tax=Methylovorus glucosotrophus (strain SIP3-4) TaxID=582744 RepID=C6XB39_METGS|nr:hypothetical protein Msip34_2572 [Methylovorus glucosotrophus SIP3-4]KAF0842929.1 hypothetical protein FNL37_0342 [Methylovorus glucosotrophus]
MLNDDPEPNEKPAKWYHIYFVELCIAIFLLFMALLNHFFG